MVVSTYGSGGIWGFVGEDKFCAEVNNVCAESQRMIAVVAQKGLSSLNSDGIAGLGARTR